jgi:uracil-DNA glycosylase
MAQSKSFPDNLPPAWRELLKDEVNQPYFKSLTKFLAVEYQKKKMIYPARENILRALQAVDYPDVKVVILGQDPYHGVGQAVGLCFSVPNDLKLKPPSLQNIFKEIATDLKVEMNPTQSELNAWANQGVLLLNTVLTVRGGQAFSHRNQGWEIFTDKIIRLLSAREIPIVFLLWGSAAHAKAEFIDQKKHYVLKAAHPSPLSAHRGFFGCRHFSKANQILAEKIHATPIDWQRTV